MMRITWDSNGDHIKSPESKKHSYPFYNGTNEWCGLIKVKCNSTVGNILIGGQKYEIVGKFDSSSSAAIRNTTFENLLNHSSCEALMHNFTSPKPLLYSISIIPFLNLFKCTKNTTYAEGTNAYFNQPNYNSYNSCKDHNFYYEYSVSNATVSSDLPHGCQVIQLPVNVQMHEFKELNVTNIFSILSPTFSLSVQLSTSCYRCGQRWMVVVEIVDLRLRMSVLSDGVCNGDGCSRSGDCCSGCSQRLHSLWCLNLNLNFSPHIQCDCINDAVSFNQTSPAVHLKHLKAIGRMSKSLSVSRNEPELMLNQLELGVTSTIVVVICWTWDVNSSTGRYLSTDFIMSDKEGYLMHCTARGNITHNFPLLKEGSVYSFFEIDDLEPTNNKYLTDAVGYVTNVGRTMQQKAGSTTLDFHLANRRLYLYSTSSSLIIDDEKILVLRRLKHDDSSGLELTKESATFHCDVKIDSIRTKNGWNFPSCGVDYPVLRYRLEIEISDDTAEVVVVLFDETTTSLLKCSASAMVASQAQRIVTDDVMKGGSNSDMVAAKADSKAPEADMNLDSNHLNLPSLSNILHTSVTIHSNIIVRRDGNIQSFCGLKLSDIHTSHTGTSAAPAKGGTHAKRKEIADTLDLPFSQTAPRTTGTEVSYHILGAPSYQCHNCNATMSYEERNNKGKRIANPTFSLCCQEGKVLLPRFIETPEPLRSILDYTEPATSCFRDQIRVYNGMFCFTSFGARIDHSTNVGRGLYTFRINGQNYHRIGSLCLKRALSLVNVELRLLSERTSSRQYNAPTIAEVAAMITNDFGDGDPTRDIIVNTKDDGYHDKISYHRNMGTCKTNRGYVTMKEYYAYVIQYKQNQGTTLHIGGRLFQQYLHGAHILLWLKDHCKCKTPEEIDDIISAKLPSPTDDPTRYKAVTGYMLHGPCGKDARNAPIQEALNRNGRSLAKFQDLPRPNPKLLTNIDNRLIREALEFDMNKSKIKDQQLHSPLNPKQRLIYEQVVESVQYKRAIFTLFMVQEAPIVAETYPNFIERQKDDAYLKERAILTPRNDDADAINAYMFDNLERNAPTRFKVKKGTPHHAIKEC
nr:serine-threonine/tyrosine-protein kinase catalytic domain-containing protein [Tanacetum cinerariifolium]